MVSGVVWQWSGQRLQQRGNTFFGARVEPDFAASTAGKAIAQEFRGRVWRMTFMLASVAAASPRLGATAAVGGGTFAVVWLFALAHRETQQHAIAPRQPSIRIAPLNAEAPNWRLAVLDWLSMTVPMAVPAATLVFLALHRNQAPAGPMGTWAITAAAASLVMGAACAAQHFALRFRARSSDWAPASQASHQYRTYVGLLASAVFTFITAQLCALSLLQFSETVPWLRHWNIVLYLEITLPAQAPWLFGIWKLRLWLNRHIATGSVDPMPDACWKWGYLYFNRNDPAAVVPLRAGVGLSLNYARPGVWVAHIAVVAAAVGLLAQTYTMHMATRMMH